MARIKFGMMMTDARGKLGGQVFSKSRSGAYIATKTIPRNVQSQSQLRVRSELAQISNAWKSLAEDVKEAWTEWAKSNPLTDEFGDKYVLTGRTYYSRNMSRLTSALGDTVDYNIIPQYYYPSDYMIRGLQINTSSGIIAGQGSSGTRPPFLSYVEMSRPIASGRKPKDSDFRLIFGELSLFPTAARYRRYVDIFGVPKTTDNVYYRFYLISPSGETGKIMEGQCVII